MTKLQLLMIIALSVTLSIGCGNDDDDSDTSSDSDTDSDGDSSIDVTYNDDTQTISLADLATTAIGESEVVLLQTILAEYDPVPSLESVTLDFEGSDGWMPGNSDNCVDTVPLDGSFADQGGIETGTRNLIWEEGADLPGCMGVDDVAVIHVADL